MADALTKREREFFRRAVLEAFEEGDTISADAGLVKEILDVLCPPPPTKPARKDPTHG